MEAFKGLHFDEKAHIYTHQGVELIPVTKYISQFKKPFNKLYWSEYKAPQLGMTPEQVRAMWDKKGKESMAIGTAVHLYAEETLLGKNPEFSSHPLTASKQACFKSFYDNHKQLFEECYVELKMFDAQLGLAGTIDLVFKFKDSWVIIDWKTNKEVSTSNGFDNLLSPFGYLQASDVNYYSLQLSTYKLILERNTDIKVSNMRIINLRQGEAIVHIAKDFSQHILRQLQK